ncbi:TonB-dependent hemoglobin/transferrin/lactoferrin family receptor [uncultured Ferrimonas sp.]|uniref:TonB-dependent hemoglobin/transferrin/lactoferrin family receptor n=1 Tax=uncultured Ferrimonas sp. TaxID=432640 RepID=UPI00262D74FF|nr:TonB-dependent hemoglobin/transferrin/lactoferrin family receptor [uncultured Ferrimonas sp.]
MPITPKPLAIAIVAALASGAAAAEQTKATLFDDVVVSASRTSEQTTDNVAAAMAVVDAEQIAEQQVSNISRLVRYEPGVSVTGSSRGGLQDFNIRGIQGNRVKIMVDGVSQANGYDSGHWLMESSRNFVDVETLKQVEITKSPSSSLYGSDSIGGTVAYTTKDPADFLGQGDGFGGQFKVGYLSEDNSFAETLVVANRSGNVESMLQYVRRDGDELENQGSVGGEGSSRTKANPLDNESNSLLGKVKITLGEHQLGFTGEHYSSTGTGAFLSQQGTTYQNIHNEDDISRYRITLNHDWDANTVLFDTLAWQLGYQDTQSEQATDNLYTSPFGGAPYDRQLRRDYGETNTQFKLDFSKTLQSGNVTHTFSYGGDVEITEMEDLKTNRHDRDLDGRFEEVSYERYSPTSESTVFGFYLQDQIQWQQLTVTAGLRYDDTNVEATIDDKYNGDFDSFDDHNSDAVTGRISALYQFNDNWSAFAQYAQGFRAPDLKELYYSFENRMVGYAWMPNPDLEAEESDSYELGLRFNGDQGAAELVLFNNEYDKFIVDVGLPSTEFPYGVTQYQNIDKASIKGVEFKGQWWLDSVLEGLSVNMAVAYAEGDNDTDNQPLNTVSPLNGVVGLDYLNVDGTYGGALTVVAAAGKDKSDIATASAEPFASAGYAVVDLTAFYNVTEQLKISGGLFNITDKKYWVWNDVIGREAGSSDLDRYTQPGRNLGLSVSYSF